MEKPKEQYYLSSTQVARALGLSVATIKRWVDEGILPAYKTAGGHRRLLLGDVERLVRQQHFPSANLRQIGAALENRPLEDQRHLARELHQALVQGDLPRVRGLIQGRVEKGMPLETLADNVIGPALTEIGLDWENGRIDVYQEHRAARICESALFEIKARLEANAEKEKPIALGGAPEHDPTVIPTLLIQMVLLDNGWRAINLGPHTPVASLRRALRDLQPKLLWLSFTHPLVQVERFLGEFRELYQEAERQGVVVVVGGRALLPHIRTAMPYTAFGDGMTQLCSLARSLHPPRRRPRRGRPPRGEERA